MAKFSGGPCDGHGHPVSERPPLVLSAPCGTSGDTEHGAYTSEGVWPGADGAKTGVTYTWLPAEPDAPFVGAPRD